MEQPGRPPERPPKALIRAAGLVCPLALRAASSLGALVDGQSSIGIERADRVLVGLREGGPSPVVVDGGA